MYWNSIQIISLLLAWANQVVALGMIIPPVATGDKRKYSGINNLLNCVSYRTRKDDIIMARIDSGDRISLQKLNLHVFDSDNNVLRTMDNMAGEQTIMFTNLNNPVQLEQHLASGLDLLSRKLGEKIHHNKNKPRDAQYDADMIPHIGKSYVYICFDNIYYDKSWSFQRSPREVTLTVDIRDINTLKETNYANYARYFKDEKKAESGHDLDTSNFNERDFESAVDKLLAMLHQVLEEIQSSTAVSESLKVRQSELRNVNEAIYETYMQTTVIILSCICVFGLVQVIYIRFYLKLKKLI